MSASKFILNGEVKIDLTTDTVTERDVAKGKTFHKADGSTAVGTSDGLDINGIIKEYKVNAGASVSAGDFVEFVKNVGAGVFHEGTTSYVSACQLDDTRVLVVYADGGANSSKAVVLTIEGMTVHIGAEVYVESYSSRCQLVALSDNKVVLCASPPSGAGRVLAKVLAINGSTIDSHTVTEVSETDGGSVISAVALTDTKILLVASRASDVNVSNTYYYLEAFILTVEGNSINASSDRDVYDRKAYSGHFNCRVAALSETRALVVYGNTSDTIYCRAVVLAIDGDTIGVGSYKQLSSTAKRVYSATLLSEDKVLVMYDGGSSVLTMNNATITTGATGTASMSGQAVALSENKVLVCGIISARVYTVDDTTITQSASTSFATSGGSSSVVPFSANSALVLYTEGAIGKYASLSIDGDTITVDEQEGTFVQPCTSPLHIGGVAGTSGAEGETVNVYTVGGANG